MANILVIGAGVIGTTYSWQLSLAGFNLAHLVRESKKDYYRENGIAIKCLDQRHGRKKTIQTVYRPDIVTNLEAKNSYDYIIVSVNSQQLKDILPFLKERSGVSTVVFLQNMRLGEDELIETYLPHSCYIIAYPFKAGGGRDNSGIDIVIFGNALSNTVLGEKDGKITPHLRQLESMLRKADMNPKIITNIIPYIRTHYIWAAASIGSYLKAGSYRKFTSYRIIKESYLAMREGWKICEKQGINPHSVAPTCYYYLPLWLMVPFTQIMYRDEGMRRMFEGHIRHSPEEMNTMYYDVLKLGNSMGIDMRHYAGFKPYVDDYFANLNKLDGGKQ
jgi:ketopantoate reductase